MGSVEFCVEAGIEACDEYTPFACFLPIEASTGSVVMSAPTRGPGLPERGKEAAASRGTLPAACRREGDGGLVPGGIEKVVSVMMRGTLRETDAGAEEERLNIAVSGVLDAMSFMSGVIDRMPSCITVLGAGGGMLTAS